MTESLNKGDVMESLSAFRLTEKDNRIGNQSLLKLMPCAEFHHSLILTGVDCCNHISCVTLDQVWVGDEYDLILTNATGDPLHRVKDFSTCAYGGGLHTVNGEGELIYLNRNYYIKNCQRI